MPSSEAARIARAIGGADRIFLAAHEDPDADAVGSLLALRSMLLSLGKRVHAATPDPPPGRFAFLEGHAAIVTTPPAWEADLAIALDCDGIQRLAGLAEPFLAAPITVNIDHHRGIEPFGDIHWIAPGAAATASLVVGLADELGVRITPSRASALYAGLIADTGGFRFTNTSPAALRLGARLIEAGADPAELARRVFTIRPLPAALLEGRALSSLDMVADGVLVASLSRNDFAQTGALPEATDGLIDRFRDVLGVRVAVLLKEAEAGVWEVSLRGNGLDVATVATDFGGGGHTFAAGCTVEGDLDGVKQRVVRALTDSLEDETRA